MLSIEWTHKGGSHYAYMGNRCVGLVRQYDTSGEWGATIKGYGINKYFQSKDNAIKFIERAFEPKEQSE